jgi:hypothetical protein
MSIWIATMSALAFLISSKEANCSALLLSLKHQREQQGESTVGTHKKQEDEHPDMAGSGDR